MTNYHYGFYTLSDIKFPLFCPFPRETRDNGTHLLFLYERYTKYGLLIHETLTTSVPALLVLHSGISASTTLSFLDLDQISSEKTLDELSSELSKTNRHVLGRMGRKEYWEAFLLQDDFKLI